jgi:hypothetical protein
MTRLTSQRGVSLMLLILMITVFAGVAVGVVTLLRARHESYPYQVQSYQAYTLAHAGVEFAIRYARENTNGNGDYATLMQSYFPPGGRQFKFGNGVFTLTYVPSNSCGQDVLLSRGTSGTATREIKLSHFSSFVAQPGTALVTINGPIGSATHYDDCSGGTCYSGSRITFNICDPILATLPNTWGQPYGQITGLDAGSPTYIAATRDGANKQVTLAGVFAGGGGTGRGGWLWDAACGVPGSSPWVPCSTPGSPPTCTAGTVGKYVAAGQTLPAWDGNTADALAQSFAITPVPHSGYSYAHFPTSGNEGQPGDRPRAGVPCDNDGCTCCDPNPSTCGTTTNSKCPPNCVDPSSGNPCGWPNPPCCTPVPCCTGSYPPRPCCYAPQAFMGGPGGGSRSYPIGTCIDTTASPTAPTHTGVTWLSRTDFTCSETDFGGNQGHVFVNLYASGGYINIETIGDITPPVTFYFHFPYRPVDYFPCRYGHTQDGFPLPCRCAAWPQWVTWTFTVTN